MGTQSSKQSYRSGIWKSSSNGICSTLICLTQATRKPRNLDVNADSIFTRSGSGCQRDVQTTCHPVQRQDLQGFQPAARNTQEVLIGHYAESTAKASPYQLPQAIPTATAGIPTIAAGIPFLPDMPTTAPATSLHIPRPPHFYMYQQEHQTMHAIYLQQLMAAQGLPVQHLQSLHTGH